MGKLQPNQVEEYFDNHLPYRMGILLAHYRMTRAGWTGDMAQLNACFVANLVTCRMFLNLLGIGKKGGALHPFSPMSTDLTAEDLGGTLVDIAALPAAHKELFYNFLKMVDQAAAHFTTPIVHDWTKTHDVILLVHQYLDDHLYARTGRTIERP